MKVMIVTLGLFLSVTSEAQAKWELIHNEEGIKIYSSGERANGVIPFKAVGKIQGPLDKVVEIMMNHEQKNQWSPKLDSVKIHQQLGPNDFIFSEFYRTPWPSTDREFLLKGNVKYLENKVIFSAKSIDNELKNEDYIQTEVHRLELTLEKIADNETAIEFSFHGDMKGWMPVWLMNLIQKKWPMRFIQGLQRQVMKQ